MSDRAEQWVATEYGDRDTEPTRKAVRTSWALLRTIARLADDSGVYGDGLELLTETFGSSKRTVQSALDRLEEGEFIAREPIFGEIRGRQPDAIVIAPWVKQHQRRPMRIPPKHLRPDED